MKKTLITLVILVIISPISFAQSTYERYLNQGIGLYQNSDYFTALEHFDLAYEFAKTNAKRLESREWRNKCKQGIKKQAKDLQDASRIKKEAILISKRAVEAERKALLAKEEAEKKKALARLKEFELSKTLKAVYFYNQQYALAFKEGLFGYINREGNTKIEYKYQQAWSFDQIGFAKVKKGDKYYLIDTVGAEYPLALSLKGITQSTKAVDLRAEKLNKIPGKLLKNHQLEVLLLADNQLDKLPGKISKLKDLKVIELIGNQLSEAEIKNIKEFLPNCSILN